jgi:uncharacterized protein YdeI (BOF family)
LHKFLIILVFASAIVSSDAMAQGAGIIPPTVPPAPVGHAQPTARSFTLDSAAAESERRRLSAFDAEQHKLDEMLDKKLNICRC